MKQHGNTKYPFATIEVGESFNVPAIKLNSMQTALRAFNVKHKDKPEFVKIELDIEDIGRGKFKATRTK